MRARCRISSSATRTRTTRPCSRSSARCSARGFRVWYDEGIEAGSEWPESIASHLERAQLVLAFLSPAYLRSDNCRKEMHYALTKKKPVINVYLEQTELSPGMEMQIGNLFALMKYTYPSEAYFYDKLFGAELLDADKFAGEQPELPDVPAPGCRARRKRKRKAQSRKAAPGKARQSAEAGAPEEKAPRSRGGDHRRRARRLSDRGRHRRPLHGAALPLHGQDRRGADAAGRHGRPVSRIRCSSRPRATMPANLRASSRSRTSKGSRRCMSAATGTGSPPRSRAWTRRPPASRRRR